MSTVDEILLIEVSRLRNILFRTSSAMLKREGLTLTQFEVLEVLLSEGRLSVGEIREKVLGTPGNIPVVINNLEKNGFVSKENGREDRRVTEVDLTDKGRALISRIYPEERDLLGELLDGSSDHDKRQAIKLLSSIRHNVDSDD